MADLELGDAIDTLRLYPTSEGRVDLVADNASAMIVHTLDIDACIRLRDFLTNHIDEHVHRD